MEDEGTLCSMIILKKTTNKNAVTRLLFVLFTYNNGDVSVVHCVKNTLKQWTIKILGCSRQLKVLEDGKLHLMKRQRREKYHYK
ncbi:hypothetical protein J2S78_003257 [Salibacterium salarium]|nr:hypothetical protein [Salibacterium salarium]